MEWIASHNQVTLAVDNIYEPLNFANEKGEIVGLNIDILKLIEQRTGLRFVLVGDTWDRSLSKAMNYEVGYYNGFDDGRRNCGWFGLQLDGAACRWLAHGEPRLSAQHYRLCLLLCATARQ